jgi:ATP-dependent Zn protease
MSFYQPPRSPSALAAAADAYHAKIVKHLDPAPNGAVEVERPAPHIAVATVLLDRALADAPDIAAALAQRGGSVIVLEVPSAPWVQPIAYAANKRVDACIMRELELEADATGVQIVADPDEFDGLGEDGDGRDGADRPSPSPSREQPNGWWFAIEAANATQRSPDTLNCLEGAAVRALENGKGVLVVAAPGAAIPTILDSGADHRLSIPRLDGMALADAAEAAFGTRPAVCVQDQLCRLLTPIDLRFAHRPEEGADQWINRLKRLAETKVDVPVDDGPTLDGLRGMDEAVAWGRNLIQDLADRDAGVLSADEIDKGCVLVGPPGTGKSTYAKRLARSAGLPLVAGSYGLWQSAGHQGQMLKSMRQAFAQARSFAPCLFFIDEIDSFGIREEMEGRNREYSIQVVNDFLQNVDEAVRDGVIFLGAANTLRIDPAILRPGRMDRIIHIDLPDQAALTGIIREYLGRHHLHGADLSEVAVAGLGGTGANVEFWVRNAKRRARRAARPMVIGDLLAEVSPAPELDLPVHYLRRVALHEAGHAVVGAVELPSQLVTVTVRQNRAGAHFRPAAMETGGSMRAMIRTLLAGRAAEEIIYGSPASGSGGPAESDLAKATALAAEMLGCHGFGSGLAWKGHVNIQTVAAVLRQDTALAAQVEAELAEQYRSVQDLLRRHRHVLDVVADLLLDRCTLSGAEVEEVVASMSSAANVTNDEVVQ